MKRKWLKKSVIALMLATVLMSTVGCGVDDIGGSGNSGKLDIDYVGEDGEVTEEEVTPESTGVMAWLKGKLSADKKQSGRHATEVASANNNTEEEESGLRGLYGQAESTNTEPNRNRQFRSRRPMETIRKLHQGKKKKRMKFPFRILELIRTRIIRKIRLR